MTFYVDASELVFDIFRSTVDVALSSSNCYYILLLRFFCVYCTIYIFSFVSPLYTSRVGARTALTVRAQRINLTPDMTSATYSQARRTRLHAYKARSKPTLRDLICFSHYKALGNERCMCCRIILKSRSCMAAGRLHCQVVNPRNI